MLSICTFYPGVLETTGYTCYCSSHACLLCSSGYSPILHPVKLCSSMYSVCLLQSATNNRHDINAGFY